MRSRYAWLLMSVIAAASVTVSSPASGARPTPAPTLGGRTTISGDATAVMDVRLERPVSLSGEQIANPSFEVTSGEGPFVGFVLLQKDVTENPAVILGGRLAGGTTADPDAPLEILLSYNLGGNLLEPEPLPAGRYSLYLITDGAPARVTLRLPGLPGRVSLEPGKRADFELNALEESLAYPDGSPLYSAGGAGNLKGDGIVFRALDIRSDAWAAGQYGYCVFAQQESEPPREVMYAPTCPASSGVTGRFNDVFVTPEPTRRVSYGAAFPLTKGGWNVSMWHTAAAALRSSDAFAFWLSL